VAQIIHLKDYQTPLYKVERVNLTFKLNPHETLVTAKVVYQRQNQDATSLHLDGEHLTLLDIAMNGTRMNAQDYRCHEHGLEIFTPPKNFELTIMTRINPKDNKALEGLYQSSGNYCTQCEAQGFRRITYYQDRPDVMAEFHVRIEAEKTSNPVLLSNGNPIAHGELDDGWHFAEWHDPFAKPCYLFALVAGDLSHVEDHFTTQSGRKVTLRIFTEAHHIHQCDHAMASLKRAMRWDEQRFGLEYDLDLFMIVAVDDFNMGAMENKGLNIFNARLVFASPETATDDDYMAIEAVIGHEYFHNWTGNRITCRDWFQLSLKEGLTVFRDQAFTADMHSSAVKRIEDVRLLRTHQFAEDASPMTHPIRPASYMEINNFYTVTVYEKGAEVVRMYHTLLGEKGFQQGMSLYVERHDGQAVTTENFLAAMNDAKGMDLSLMQRWYEQAGTPTLSVQMDYNATQKTCTLHCQQSCPSTPECNEKKAFLIPLSLGLLLQDGSEAPLQLEGESQAQGITRTLCITQKEQSFIFMHIPERPIPSLLRHFSAPVHLKYKSSEQDLAFLMAYDSDVFNRWNAAQTLAMNTMLSMLSEDTSSSDVLIHALRQLLNDKQLDAALKAEALLLPSENDVLEASKPANPVSIHRIREELRSTIGNALYDDFLCLYQSCHTVVGLDDKAMQQRKLKAVCLGYMMATSRQHAIDVCYLQFQSAKNMTDQYAALALLASSDCPERILALQAFEQQWQHDTNVMDKWFAVQASSSLSHTLEAVQFLMQHPQFHISNPNKVRALIGGFATRNPAQFHQDDGKSYAFLAQQVLQLDAINPQVAARMVRPLMHWRDLDSTRSNLMYEQLKSMAKHQGLSGDVFEIVSKSL